MQQNKTPLFKVMTSIELPVGFFGMLVPRTGPPPWVDVYMWVVDELVLIGPMREDHSFCSRPTKDRKPTQQNK